MTPTVFFSWQSDSLPHRNTRFIRAALEEAVTDLAIVELPIRVDAAAEGIAGTPDIPSTIFEKLNQTAVAVFDVTPVGFATRTEKPLPNPNVLLELGFACGMIGWDRVILIMNTADGNEPEQLPFDLRHRRFPVCYKALSGDEERERARLARLLRDYINLALQTNHLALDRIRRRLSLHTSYILDKFGERPSFPWQTNFLTDEVHRLIDLGLLFHDIDPAKDGCACQWTYLGSELCKWYSARIAERKNSQKPGT